MAVYRIMPLPDVEELQKSNFSIFNSSNSERCVIVGGDSSTAWSLLFQAAVSYAKDDQVIFLCPKPLNDQPLFVAGMIEPIPLLLDCIKMVYLPNSDDLMKYLADFHCQSCLPSAIIVHNFEHFVPQLYQDPCNDAGAAKCFAMLEDTTAFVSQKKGQQCHQIISISNIGRAKSFIKQYFQEIWHLSSENNSAEMFMTSDHVPAFRIAFHVDDREKIVMDRLFRLPVAENVG